MQGTLNVNLKTCKTNGHLYKKVNLETRYVKCVALDMFPCPLYFGSLILTVAVWLYREKTNYFHDI